MRYIIGRGRECDVAISDDSVSRRHAELSLAGDGRIVLKDCGSSNGTFVIRAGRQQQLTEEQVYPHDEVRFGVAKFAVRELILLIDLKPGTDTVRCSCGMLKHKDAYCTECGQR